MLKLIPGSLGLAALCTLSLAALADETPAPAPAAAAPSNTAATPADHPAAELAALQFLAGHFSCTGSWRNPAGASVAKQSKLSSRWKLDHYFLVFDYEQPASKEQPHAISASGYWGWDANRKKYVHSAINNHGLAVTLYADPGGDALVFKGEGGAGSGSAQGPLSFTFKKAPKGFTMITVAERDGKQETVSEETCSK